MQVNGVYRSVELQMRVVDFLIDLNTNRRADKTVDKAFIKSLLIGVLSVKAIKAGEKSDGYISFIEGAFFIIYQKITIVSKQQSNFSTDLFSYRVNNDETRLESFDDLVSTALTEIINMK